MFNLTRAARGAGLAALLGACGPTTKPPPAIADAALPSMTSASSAAAATTQPPVSSAPHADGLRTLLLLKPFARMVDCGHDGGVAPLYCSFTDKGAAHPVKDEHTLRVFVTDPPGLVLAAAKWHLVHKLGDAKYMSAECHFESRGKIHQPRLAAATEGVPGWLYDGSIEVGVVSDCAFAPYAIPKRLSASHLVLAHHKATRRPSKVKRTVAEALSLAREAAARLEHGEPFAQLADSVSDDRIPGGRLGLFSIRAMAPEFSIVLLATPYGEHSVVFETSFGFHVLQRHAIKASKTATER